MFKRLMITSVAAAALLLGSPLSAAEASGTPAKEQQVLNPKVFEFTDTDGQKIEILISEKGIKLLNPKEKNAVLMFYIYSGTPCRNELQLFTKLKPDQLREFEKELNLKGLRMVDSAQALPFAKFIAQLIQWPGSVPLIIAVTKNGEVRHMQLGAMKEDEIKKLAETLSK